MIELARSVPVERGVERTEADARFVVVVRPSDTGPHGGQPREHDTDRDRDAHASTYALFHLESPLSVDCLRRRGTVLPGRFACVDRRECGNGPGTMAVPSQDSRVAKGAAVNPLAQPSEVRILTPYIHGASDGPCRYRDLALAAVLSRELERPSLRVGSTTVAERPQSAGGGLDDRGLARTGGTCRRRPAGRDPEEAGRYFASPDRARHLNWLPHPGAGVVAGIDEVPARELGLAPGKGYVTVHRCTDAAVTGQPGTDRPDSEGLRTAIVSRPVEAADCACLGKSARCDGEPLTFTESRGRTGSSVERIAARPAGPILRRARTAKYTPSPGRGRRRRTPGGTIHS